MTRTERARLRLIARRFAYDYLGVPRLPKGVPAIVRAYADGFTVYPLPSEYGDPMSGLARQLAPYRKLAWVV